MTREKRQLVQGGLLSLLLAIALLAALFASLNSGDAHIVPVETSQQFADGEAVIPQEFSVVVDDFIPLPEPGQLIYPFNRLGGDRGALNYSLIDSGSGLLTATIGSGRTWGGLWTSLNHPIGEATSTNFSAALPTPIQPAYQSPITGISVSVARGTPGLAFRLELKDYAGVLRWNKEISLEGGSQTLRSDLPSLANIKELLWVLDGATGGDYVVVDSVSLTATTQITDTAAAGFVWSYSMLLDNWDPATGLVRDKARFASGQFDAIQATGSLAAVTAVAGQLGVVEAADARQIVTTISDTLLLDVPRHKTGLWPHFVISNTGAITIAPGTEWSSVDTAIAAIALLDGQSGLGLDTSGTEAMIRSIDWVDMVRPNGISHGYGYDGSLLDSTWDVFGGESWLVELAYASAKGQATPLAHPSPPTANGSGFIDELAWLYTLTPKKLDYWGSDWEPYRQTAAQGQIDYFREAYPDSCFAKLGLFGLSAAEVPTPWTVPGYEIYQAFGVGGQFASSNDGAWLLGAPVIAPHYSAMIAGMRPVEAMAMWAWLIHETPFSPLNNVESLMFKSGLDCEQEEMAWNQLKGSWNLALQALGLGNYLLQRDGQEPVTRQATLQDTLLGEGFRILAPGTIVDIHLPSISKDKQR
jgi:hypothetical protein